LKEPGPATVKPGREFFSGGKSSEIVSRQIKGNCLPWEIGKSVSWIRGKERGRKLKRKFGKDCPTQAEDKFAGAKKEKGNATGERFTGNYKERLVFSLAPPQGWSFNRSCPGKEMKRVDH